MIVLTAYAPLGPRSSPPTGNETGHAGLPCDNALPPPTHFRGVLVLGPSRRRRQSPSPLPRVLAALAVVAVLIGIGWLWLGPDREDAPPPASTEASTPPPAPESDPAEETGPAQGPEELDLPELDASDEFIRRVVAGLSARPELAAWLTPDELVRRFVRVVVDLAGESNPAANISHVRPDEPFQVRTQDGRTYMSEGSFRRYDPLAATVASLDTEGTVQLYRQLLPLMEEAYRELGIPGPGFEELVEMSIANVLTLEPNEEPMELVGEDGIYVYADPELEAQRGLEKAFLRMGPENTRRIQSKVRELRDELARVR
jgi:hypothetical protein